MKIARLSDQAKADLVQIWEYIAEDNPTAADRFIQKLITQYKSLAENPGVGRSRADLRPQLRSFPVGSYLIFYRPIAEGIAIVRILHGMREMASLFQRETEETYRPETAEDETLN